MHSFWYPHPALAASTIGVAISVAIIGGGLLWLLLRSIKGQEVDRRIIFVFIFVSVAAPLLFPLTFSERATPVVMGVFDKIESLPEGSTVLLSYDFDPAMAPDTLQKLVVKHVAFFKSGGILGSGQAGQAAHGVCQGKAPGAS